jgi:DNA (cytosine-5)-methyltransferase 1
LLDLFCGGGGAAMGYHRAGFEVVGVDINPHPRYPFEFHQADATTYPLDGFDAIHASPPCQAHSVAVNIRQGSTKHPDLIAAVRARLIGAGAPYVIENVPGAPLVRPVVLCGLALGLNVKRHRAFEASFGLPAAPACPPGHPGEWVTVFGGGAPKVPDNRRRARADAARLAMGIDWMSRDELSQAVPPAYTQWVGAHLLAAARTDAGVS